MRGNPERTDDSHEIGAYVQRIRDNNIGDQFSKTNLLFEIDQEVIVETLYSSKYERWNSIFLLDTELNLIEYQCDKKIMKTYLNKHQIKGHVDHIYNKRGEHSPEEDQMACAHVQMALDDKLEHLVIFVTTMKSLGDGKTQPLRY
jgi:hypothetical protein